MADLLFLTQRIPYPPNKGEKIRSWKILSYLARRHRVHLGCFIDDPDDWQHVPVLQAECGECLFVPLRPALARIACLRGLAGNEPLSKPYFHSRRLAGWVREMMARHRPALAFISSSQMAQYLLDLPDRPRRVILDYVDVDSDKWRQYAATRAGPMRRVYARESRTLLAYDRRVGTIADAAVFVSRAEAELFRRLAPELAERTHAVNNGVDSAYFSPAHGFADPFPPGGPALVFTGTMSYWPNIDAVTWFARAILPRIRKRRPDLRFVIVGASPDATVRQLASQPGIVVTGRVADVRPYLAHARLVVAPLRVANGVQNKVIEAMAMAKAVIATPRALAGIAADHASEVILAEAEESFAAAVLAAVDDPDLAALGARARARILADYAWEKNLTAFDPLLSLA